MVTTTIGSPSHVFWTFIAQPRRGEHSLWKRADQPDLIYVADCSGSNPSKTEDGPTYLDGPLTLRRGWNSAVVADVTIKRPDGSHAGYTSLHQDVALWLVEHHGFRVTIGSNELVNTAKLLAGVR